MNKLILCSMLAVGIGCAKENCSFTGIDEEEYRASYIKVYTFQCTGITGYDYVEHKVWVNFGTYLKAIFSSYYIDDIERKTEYFGYTEYHNKDETVEDLGEKSISLYDEFHIQIKYNDYYTSIESMEKTILNKWNRLKKYINNCPPSWKINGKCSQDYKE